jgi:AraC-like DNA-binding protein
MMYKSFLPSPQLSEFVRNYTIIHFQFNPDEPIPFKQRSPKAEEIIVFYLMGTPNLQNALTGAAQTPPAVSIFGNQLDQKTIQMTAEFFSFIIFLKPGVLHRMTRLPMTELFQEYCDAELFFGTQVRLISEELALEKSDCAMISVIERFLLAQCNQLVNKSSVDAIAAALLTDPVSFSLDTIAKHACLSTKQFYRRFTQRIGISPKLFSRLSRFNHTYRYKLAHPHVTWSSIAQEFAYTDYHHLEKEFKEFTSLTPNAWINTHLTAPERILQLR